MTEELLNGADIVVLLQQVSSERVAKRVARGGLGDAHAPHSVLDGPLEDRFVQVMAAPLASEVVHIDARRWEDPLPPPLATGFRILARQCPWQFNPSRVTTNAVSDRQLACVPRTR